MLHVHWLNVEKKCPFTIYGVHIKWGKMNETRDETTELSSKCQFNNHCMDVAIFKNVFPFRFYVSWLYKCPFNTKFILLTTIYSVDNDIIFHWVDIIIHTLSCVLMHLWMWNMKY